VFLFNLPFAAVTLALAYHYVPRDEPLSLRLEAGGAPRLRVRDLDPLGIALFAGATGMGVATLLNLQAAPGIVIGLAVGALSSGLLFLRWERRTRTPFIPLSLFSSKSKLGRTYARVALFNTVFYAIYYGWPIWLERGRGLSPSTTGLVTLPIAAIGAVAAMGATRVSRGRGPRRALLIGSAVLLSGCLALLGIGAATPIPLLVAVAAVLGVPNGFNSVGNQLATYQQAPSSLAGVAAGLQRTSSYIGANIASALVGLTVSASGSRGSSASLHVLAGILAAIATSLLLGAILNRSLSEASVAGEIQPPSAAAEQAEPLVMVADRR
jgi:hypothetical protein